MAQEKGIIINEIALNAYVESFIEKKTAERIKRYEDKEAEERKSKEKGKKQVKKKKKPTRYTKGELAKSINTSSSVLSTWLGGAPISREYLDKLCKVLKIEEEKLYTDDHKSWLKRCRIQRTKVQIALEENEDNLERYEMLHIENKLIGSVNKDVLPFKEDQTEQVKDERPSTPAEEQADKWLDKYG